VSRRVCVRVCVCVWGAVVRTLLYSLT
jgi:hypothetical protein